MGMGKNIILLTFILSFSLWGITGKGTAFTDIVTCFQNPNSPLIESNNTAISGSPLNQTGVCTSTTEVGILPGQTIRIQNTLYTVLWAIISALIVIAGISILTGRFPDPYAIFSVAGLFLLAFVTFPLSLMASAGDEFPLELKLLMGGIFGIAYIVSFFEFYKGGTL